MPVSRLIIADAELAARPLVQQIAESGNPVFAVMSRRAEHRIGDPGPEKPIELRIAAQFFDAEVERIDVVRVDQDRRNAGASQDGGRGRTRQATANESQHRCTSSKIPMRKRHLCARKG